MQGLPFPISIAGKILRSRKFIIVFAILAGIFSPVAALSSSQNTKATHADGFLALSILNKDMNTREYFTNHTTVNSEENVNWYIKIQNSMNKAEYVYAKIKLLNSTQISPDDKNNSPSPEREIYKLAQVIPADSTWTAPLNWSIVQTEIHDNYVIIKAIKINDKLIDNLDIRSANGNNFRFVLELWIYDTSSDDFSFLWSSPSNEKRSVWNEIWFSVKN